MRRSDKVTPNSSKHPAGGTVHGSRNATARTLISWLQKEPAVYADSIQLDDVEMVNLVSREEVNR